jgi:hypothetical protein
MEEPPTPRCTIAAALACLFVGALLLTGGSAGAMPATRGCGHAEVATATGRLELYFRTRHTGCVRAKQVVRGYFRRVARECSGSGCFITLPSRWRCHTAPGAVTEADGPGAQCSREHGRRRILTSRFADKGFEPDRLVRRGSADHTPKMLFPTLDYGSRTGGTIWHVWIKPHGWSDGDDVIIRQARWLSWNRERAVARVRVVIGGSRGRGKVNLSDPGYCPAAHAFGYLRETDRGGPWGQGGTIDLRGQCEASGTARRSVASLRRPLRLAHFERRGGRFEVKPATLGGLDLRRPAGARRPERSSAPWLPPRRDLRQDRLDLIDRPRGDRGRGRLDRRLRTILWEGEWQSSPTYVIAYRPRRGTFQRMRFVCDREDPVGTRARLRLRGKPPPQWEILRQW